jgi:hypothetical protein
MSTVSITPADSITPATCKALVGQGVRKGQPCLSLPLENGYCVHHQRNYEHENALRANKKICGMFFRGCDEELMEEDVKKGYKWCITCRRKKSGKDHPCAYDGCTFMIEDKEQKYCKKHIRQLLRDNEEEKGIRYCDIERGCFGVIVSGVKCEGCKEKDRVQVSKELVRLREKFGIPAVDEEKLREAYPLSYALQESKLIGIAELWRGIQRNAYIRKLLFLLRQEEFEHMVCQPCYYCGFYSSYRLGSVDRADNNKGYLLSNCIPSCKACNMVKGGQHPIEFLSKVEAIYDYHTTGQPLSDELIQQWKHVYLSTTHRMPYERYEKDTKKREMEFLLTEEEYKTLLAGSCYLCGLPNRDGHENGIDRMVSTIRSYQIDNCKTCCGHCNVMKKEMSHDEFMEKCKQIHDHRPDRTLFEKIPMYRDQKCRKEAYTSIEIAQLMKSGGYMSYIEWCVEHRRSPEFIDTMNQLQHDPELDNDRPKLIEEIHKELQKERNRKRTEEEQQQLKTINCRTLYSLLTQGKEDDFVKWYETHYTKSELFHNRLRDLMDQLPSLTHDAGIEACRDFMTAEKHRRVSEQRRNDLKKVTKYAPEETSTEMEEKNVQASSTLTQSTTYPDRIPRRIPAPRKARSVAPPTPAPSPAPAPAPAASVESKEENDTKDSVVEKVVMLQEQVGYQKKSSDTLKQWKTSNIYRAIQQNLESEYKAFCEENNDMSLLPTWETEWATFVLSVKKAKEADALPVITAFVENLRRIRHNKLCYDRNAGLVEKERQQWPATTVVRAYLDGKIDAFKAFTEASTGEDPADPKWVKRWTGFLESLEEADDREEMKTRCSKFMTAQRTKKYRASVKAKA